MFELYGFGHMLFAGVWVTVKVTLSALLFGLVLGLIGAGAKLSRFKFLQKGAEVFTTVVRGIPELILILFVYFGATILVNDFTAYLGYDKYIEINAFAAGVIALGTAFGAYATDVFKESILAVPAGQLEAAKAIGMNKFLAFRRILLPQIWRFALPGLGNLFLVLQKDSALIMVIGLKELMKATAIAVGYTKKPFSFCVFTAFIYLGLSIITTAAMQYLEKRANRGVGGR